MGEIAIRAFSLGKSYRIDHQSAARYRTLGESLTSLARHPLRRDRLTYHETIWALKDVSFEVNRGEALGIIGRNGAGKSTLLKVLSRITQPTTGHAEVYGRLGALLEVGTGFHPELTGRENIFLNGSILGMSRRDVSAAFDEIVAFAETERFLDTPVKHYSTGMYTRLAFAVAAHLQTDILVVDEVLAVGDAAFQAKCLGKMADVAGQGRTVLFVSHNLGAVSRLCSSAVLLEGGRVVLVADAPSAVARYLEGDSLRESVDDKRHANGSGATMVTSAKLYAADGTPSRHFSIGDDLLVHFGLRVSPAQRSTKLAVSIRATDGTPIAHVVDVDSGFGLAREGSDWQVTVRFRDLRLYPGSYLISLWAVDQSSTEVFDHVEDCLEFIVLEGGRLSARTLPRAHGFLFLTPDWTAERATAVGRPE